MYFSAVAATGFSTKASTLATRLGAARGAGPDIAIAGTRDRGGDAERDNVPLGRGLASPPRTAPAERLRPSAPHGRRRKCADAASGARAGGEFAGDDATRRTESPARRGSSTISAGHADLLHCSWNQETIVVVVGDDHRRVEDLGVEAQQGVLEGRAFPEQAMNCFGMVSREAGQTRVPAPPHMITGMIFFIETPEKDVKPITLPLRYEPRKTRRSQRRATARRPLRSSKCRAS